jgi:hypothetical protein
MHQMQQMRSGHQQAGHFVHSPGKQQAASSLRNIAASVVKPFSARCRVCPHVASGQFFRAVRTLSPNGRERYWDYRTGDKTLATPLGASRHGRRALPCLRDEGIKPARLGTDYGKQSSRHDAFKAAWRVQHRAGCTLAYSLYGVVEVGMGGGVEKHAVWSIRICGRYGPAGQVALLPPRP